MNLSGQKKKELREAIESAFTLDRFKMLLVEDLEEKVSNIKGDDYETFIFNTISQLEANNKIEELIQAAREKNPGNEQLKAVQKEVIGDVLLASGINLIADTPAGKPTSLRERTLGTNPLQSFLLILIEPILQPKDKHRFNLKAIFIEDFTDGTVLEKEVISAQIEKFDIKNKTVVENINQCVNFCRKQLYGKKYELIVEFFLTYKHLSSEIEQFLIDKDLLNNFQKERFGELYRLVMRSYDRACSPDSYNNLLRKWDRLNQLSAEADWQTQFKIGNVIQEKNWKALKNKLLGNNQIVFRICSDFPANAKHRESLFGAINEAGIPICLWTRCSSLPDVDIEEVFDGLLSLETAQNLSKLSTAIWELRRKAYEDPQKQSQCLGYHLGCLYDNPQRVPAHLKDINRLLSPRSGA